MANQVIPVIVQRFQAQIAVQGLVEPQRTGVGINGICGGSALSELFFKILRRCSASSFRSQYSMYSPLPIYNLIDNPGLLRAAAPQINPSGLQALMSQKIRQQRDIPGIFDKIFGKAVAEGMGVHNLGSRQYRTAKSFSRERTR